MRRSIAESTFVPVDDTAETVDVEGLQVTRPYFSLCARDTQVRQSSARCSVRYCMASLGSFSNNSRALRLTLARLRTISPSTLRIIFSFLTFDRHKEATRAYEKSLSLNPNNGGAATMLKRLKGGR